MQRASRRAESLREHDDDAFIVCLSVLASVLVPVPLPVSVCSRSLNECALVYRAVEAVDEHMACMHMCSRRCHTDSSRYTWTPARIAVGESAQGPGEHN